jgi:pimeloyl-ACP methyl ester carboxylesterase
MEEDVTLLLHGYASSANSHKAHYLRQKFHGVPRMQFEAFDFNPTPNDFEFMTITGMINRLRQHILGHDLTTVNLIGSSMGALVGLHYAHRFRGVKRMLLLAPALFYDELLGATELNRWQRQGVAMVHHYAFMREVPLRYGIHADGQQYKATIPPPVPIVIVHGRNDDVVPIDRSRNYAATYGDMVSLIEVDSDHRLNERLDFIWKQLQRFLIDGDEITVLD